MGKKKRHIPHSSTIQTKLLALLLLSVGLPMILFVGQFRNYSSKAISNQVLEAEGTAFHTGLRNLQEQIQLVTYAARSFYFNIHVLDLLEGRGGYDTITDRQEAEDYIFYMMQSIYSVVPDASLIHMTAYKLDQHFYLSRDYDRIVEPLKESEASAEAPVRAYGSYLQAGADYTGRITLKERSAFTVCLPLYAPPSITDPLGEIMIVIPESRIKQLCSTLFDESRGETLYVLSNSGFPLYSSESKIPDWALNLFDDTIILPNERYTTSLADGSTVFYERIQQKVVDLKVIRTVPSTLLRTQADTFVQVLLMLFFCALVMTALFLSVSALSVTQPLKKLAAYTRAVNLGQLDANMEDYIVYPAQDEIGTLVTGIDDMMHTINHYIIRQYRLDAVNKTIQLQMLQAQINPHFLYNTLQCLAGEALSANAPELYTSIASLGQMMQYAMDTAHMMVPLEREKDYAEHYLRLQQLRFPAKLNAEWIIAPEAADIFVPKMILQPLIENSVRHGGILHRENCTLTVRADVDQDILVICVQDDGNGTELQVLTALQKKLERVRRGLERPDRGISTDTSQPESPSSDHSAQITDIQKNAQTLQTHIGLANVYQRLLLHFGPSCRIELYPIKPHGLRVSLYIPIQQERKEDTP